MLDLWYRFGLAGGQLYEVLRGYGEVIGHLAPMDLGHRRSWKYL